MGGIRRRADRGASLVDALRSKFVSAEVFNGYGMTETSSLTTLLPDGDALEHADSVGYAVPSVDIAVKPVGDDATTGELLVRGANVMSGYWNRPEATAQTITDGWLHTGDVIRVDEAGRVHVGSIGRRTSLTAGVRTSPAWR